MSVGGCSRNPRLLRCASNDRQTRSMNRLETTFTRLRDKGEKALIAYLMAGDPTLDDTEAYVQQLAQTGADIIELGVPFSDPIADGPVIQQAAERALRSGTSLKKLLGAVRSLRTKTQIPLVLMAYYNSIFRYGEAAFCRDAVAAGGDGLIVPDMPPGGAGTINPLAETAGLGGVFLPAPTSTARRGKAGARVSRGFIYFLLLNGETGGEVK